MFTSEKQTIPIKLSGMKHNRNGILVYYTKMQDLMVSLITFATRCQF